DLTFFWGASPTVETRSAKGIALGTSATVFGAEFEYSRISEETVTSAPGLKTYMGNGMLITPGKKAQLYLTAGFGRYNETLNAVERTGTATNVGGGIKYKLLGPINIRADYRAISLRGSPVTAKPKRFYVGVSLGR